MAKYTVKAGDTLSAIAKKHGTTVDAILKENTFIKNKNSINVGWVLSIGETGKKEPETAPAPAKDYAAIGKQVEICMQKIAELPDFKVLEALL